MIGLIMLMGIATKNAILLIDYVILARRDHGLDRWDALLDACRKRARPIVMTTVAMGAGMLPIAIGVGTDPSFRAPMAIVVIGGLITSTFLSLLVVPGRVHLRRRRDRGGAPGIPTPRARARPGGSRRLNGPGTAQPRESAARRPCAGGTVGAHRAPAGVSRASPSPASPPRAS